MKKLSNSLITVRVPLDMKEQLEQLAKASGKKLSAVLKDILSKELANN
jgi:predicted DNA-binding protein